MKLNPVFKWTFAVLVTSSVVVPIAINYIDPPMTEAERLNECAQLSKRAYNNLTETLKPETTDERKAEIKAENDEMERNKLNLQCPGS